MDEKKDLPDFREAVYFIQDFLEGLHIYLDEIIEEMYTK